MKTSDTILETPRLIIRQWREADIAPMIAISQDPKVMEHFESTRTEQQTRAFIATNNEIYNSLGYCFYAVELKDTAEFIGFVGLIPVDADSGMPFAPTIEIGWRLATKFWGQGYAPEAAQAVMDQAFNTLGIEELVSFTIPANVNSIKVMQKLGFTRDEHGDFDHPKIEAGHPKQRCVLYRKKA